MGRTRDQGRCIWIYGRHACVSALQNPNRACRALLATREFLRKHPEVVKLAQCRDVTPKKSTAEEIAGALNHGAVHQGVALKVSPIFGRKNAAHRIEDVVSSASSSAVTSTIVILDQITDVHNVGAIIRSAACFNVDAVVLPERHSSSESCATAKISSGATDLIPIIHVSNLVRTMEYLKQNGYWCYGLDISGNQSLHEVNFCKHRVVVLGSEGRGIRRLTREHCDHLIRIPMSSKIDSLNVSNAAAIALYSSYLQR
ncbi:MAG: 23S rRNA (guanosine(2251)-2'-O)-methyltransferase RlmB [Anaplasma sp.]